MSRLRRSVLHCRIGQKRLSSAKNSARLAYGYRVMGAINREIAEKSVASDNETLASAEQKLTECEAK